jgi:two-component system sensor histidine kinase KdpD
MEAFVGVVIATLCFFTWPSLLREHVDTLYILVVVIAATRGGTAPAVATCLLSLLCWRLLVMPAGQLPLSYRQAMVSVPIFLVVAVLTGQVAAGGRRRALEAQARERETKVLYELGLALAQEADVSRFLELLATRASQLTHIEHCSFWQPGPWRRRAGMGSESVPTWPSELASQPVPVGDAVAYPLRVEDRAMGLMWIRPAALSEAESRLLSAIANHAALALSREELDLAASQARASLEAERLKSSLLASVTHDLRTPLASIKACATSLASEDVSWEDKTRRALLSSVIKNADRLDTFVGNLLDVSRLEAGAWRPIRESFPLLEILASVLGRLSDPQAARVVVDVPDDLPLVNVDGLQMEQILWNLLENALKYSPPDSSVELRARVEDGTLHMTVRDHGPGVPSGQEELIFQKFYRARQEGGPPGLGIGLSICQFAVHAHGGRIWVHHAPDGGAVFEFELPA